MIVIIDISLFVRVVAMLYSIYLVWRFRDWRLSIMTLMLGTLILRQLLVLKSEDLSTWDLLTELPALMTSILTLPAIYFMGRAIRGHEQAAQEARESKMRFEELAHRITDVFWSVDWEKKRTTYVSPGYREIFGRDPEALYANTLDWTMSIHPDDRQRITDLFLREAPTGRFNCEYRIVRPDGSIRWIRDRGFPVADDKGIVRRIAGLAEDITERKLTEESLRQANAQLKMSITATNLGLWTWDVKTGEVYFSTRWKAQLGYEDHEIGNRFEEWESRLHPDDRQNAVQYALDYVKNPSRDYHNEFRLRHKDGSYRWIYVLGGYYPEADGSMRRMMGCHIDFTERKLAEEALRASEHRFHSMARISPVGLFRTLRDGRCTYVNEQWCVFTGLTSDQAMGDGWVKALHPEDREATLRAWNQREAVPVHVEFRWRRPDGSDVWVLGQAAPDVDAEGTVLGYVGSITDITERKRAEQRQRLLLSELDHRVKNNLTAVLSLAQQTIGASHTLEEFRAAFIGRVRAMAQSHAVLASAHGKGFEFREAARLILAPFMQDEPSRIQISGDALTLPARAGLPIALSFHELATNAAKHGSLSVATGKVQLTWARVDGHVRFTWSESGGPTVHPPKTGGIGYELIRGLIAFELRGKVDVQYAPTGLICTLQIPVNETIS